MKALIFLLLFVTLVTTGWSQAILMGSSTVYNTWTNYVAGTNPPAGGDVTNGIIGWWKMDEQTGTNVADSSESNFDGTFAGTPTWTNAHNGQGIKFNTAGTYINLASQPTITNEATIMFWVKVFATANQRAVTQWDGGQAYQIFPWGDGKFYYEFGGGTYYAVFPYALDHWYHVAWVHSETNNIDNVYTNSIGSLLSTYVKVFPTAGYLRLGGNSAYSLNGILADVRVYNRALSSNEVYQVYQATQ